jgi:ABC-type nitrate/sulfonate/bicarbonate transport system substrate-binding protein
MAVACGSVDAGGGATLEGGAHRLPRGLQLADLGRASEGLFRRNDLAVNVTPTPSSVFQLTNLIEGKFDIAMTGIDNVIAYMEGQGAAPTKKPPDLVVFMGGDNGFLRLVTVPEVKSYAQLKGRELSVDALTTGYAFVLRKLLEKGGLRPDDYHLVSADGVLQRFEGLLEKKHAGTLLISPFDVVAQARSFNRLASSVGCVRGALHRNCCAG